MYLYLHGLIKIHQTPSHYPPLHTYVIYIALYISLNKPPLLLLHQVPHIKRKCRNEICIVSEKIQSRNSDQNTYVCYLNWKNLRRTLYISMNWSLFHVFFRIFCESIKFSISNFLKCFFKRLCAYKFIISFS